MELRRKQLKGIEVGDLCAMIFALKEDMKITSDYVENGNISQLYSNSYKRIHIADVKYFYCSNDNAFNNKDLIEVIPVEYDTDLGYRLDSLRISIKRNTKYIVERKSFFIIQDESKLNNFHKIKLSMDLIKIKYNLNLSKWMKKLELIGIK